MARDAYRGLGQHLRIGLTQIAAVQVVVPVLKAFREENPFARIRLSEGTSASLETQVEQNLIDVLRLKRAPGFLGTGTRLFGDSAMTPKFKCVETRRYDDGYLYQEYTK